MAAGCPTACGSACPRGIGRSRPCKATIRHSSGPEGCACPDSRCGWSGRCVPRCPGSPARRTRWPGSQPQRRSPPAASRPERWTSSEPRRSPRHPAAIRRAVRALVGLGSGSTPGGDDVVAGTLAGLHAIGRDVLVQQMWAAARDDLAARTTLVSADLLRLAARGHACAEAIGVLRAASLSGPTAAGRSMRSPWQRRCAGCSPSATPAVPTWRPDWPSVCRPRPSPPPPAAAHHQTVVRTAAMTTAGAATAGAPSTRAVEHLELRRGIYHDSVTLLRISQAASDAPGIVAAQVAMATPLNIELAAGLGFAIPEAAGPNDLLVALRGADDSAIAAGLSAIDGSADGGRFSEPGPGRVRRRGPTAHGPHRGRPRARRGPGAALGARTGSDRRGDGRHLRGTARHDLLRQRAGRRRDRAEGGGRAGRRAGDGSGLRHGHRRGRRVRVRQRAECRFPAARGVPTVGVIAASGTGAQQLTCLLDEAGVPVSAVLGLGGRDLSEAVGGRSALTALAMLDADPGTDHIVLISKPPHRRRRIGCWPPQRRPAPRPAPCCSAPGGPTSPQQRATCWACSGCRSRPGRGGCRTRWRSPGAGALRGLYAGGTLADEAMIVAAATLGDIRSNIPLRPDLGLPPRRDHPRRAAADRPRARRSSTSATTHSPSAGRIR